MVRSRIAITVEEFANIATHGLGLVASVVAFPLLVVLAVRAGDAAAIVGVSIFAATLVGAYAASTIYHSMPSGPRRVFWRRVDQSAVYLLIAGTYTPLALGVLRGPLGWTLLAIVWAAALVGIGAKLGLGKEAPTLETLTFLGMGWLVVVAIQPLLDRLGWAGFLWLLAGGLAYTIGTIFLVCQSRIRYGHCAWHVFVLGGSACHAVAIANYALTVTG
jgi:hemolysin III